MSYILDALKKSAEERRKLQELKAESRDPLSIVQEPRGSKPRSRFPLLPVSLLLIAAVAGIWYYYDPIKADRPMVDPAVTAPSSNQDLAGTVVEQAEEQQQEIMPPAVNEPSLPAITPEPRVTEAPPRLETVPQPAGPPPAPVLTGVKPSPAPQPVIPLLKELPFATQAAIPEMKFSGHVYSPDPSLRLIMVNTSIVREGDIIAPDVKLIEITENGIVLSFQQKPFRVELF